MKTKQKANELRLCCNAAWNHLAIKLAEKHPCHCKTKTILHDVLEGAAPTAQSDKSHCSKHVVATPQFWLFVLFFWQNVTSQHSYHLDPLSISTSLILFLFSSFLSTFFAFFNFPFFFQKLAHQIKLAGRAGRGCLIFSRKHRMNECLLVARLSAF